MAINYGPNTLDYVMSNLISNRRAASRVNQTPSPTDSVAATSPPDMSTTSVSSVLPFSPTVSSTSLTSLVMHPLLSTRWTHRRSQSSEEVEQSGKVSSVHVKGGPCRLLNTSKSTRTTTEKITITWDTRHRDVATKEQHSALVSDIGSVIRNHCPLLWDDLHKHYEKYNGPEEKMKANSINRSKKKLLHHSTTFLRHKMSDVTSFVWRPLCHPTFPAIIFALARRLSLRCPSSYA
ncbi:hypothetical protein D8674_037982 [Pyrus ussuriensis x Pyrus communis]|uniref:Uncharacterized protein n=1 Tax=Pyrus ussuriensis x Pyrus communis TaxID=2448454 RepID=A0A5N5FTZ5_9ROSA|nr:hypothetical protein D8674_037982 [Pyrus ussuriensis x Pyrus communis]